MARYPIVLACGFTRFDEVPPWKWLQRPGRDDFHYFKRIRSTLQAAGFQAFHTQVAWGAPLTVRAAQLRREIDSILAISGAPKVHIIAHSMGGLDARYAINELDGAGKVRSLTTIATPHHGSPLADLVYKPNTRRQRLIERLHTAGIDVRGLADLTTQACEACNARWAHTERSNGIHYQAFAGMTRFALAFTPLKLGYVVLRFFYGKPHNDGLVAVESARWDDDRFRGVVPWDHFNQIGWWTFDRILAGDFVASTFERSIREFYLRVAAGLAEVE